MVGLWGGSPRALRIAVAVSLLGFCLLTFGAAPSALAADPHPRPDETRGGPSGVHVLDGSYVMNVGELQVNITNHGLIGSQFTTVSTFADAPSAQWPAGSGIEYLWSAGLWVGGELGGEIHVTTGQYERELRPLDDLRDTIYEARNGRIVRPAGFDGIRGKRLPDPGYDDDHDGRIDEEVLNGYDDDGDGLIDEDFGQVADQMMVCTMYDDTRLATEIYPDHKPLHLKVEQQSCAWASERLNDFVGLNYTITNTGEEPIHNAYIGFFVDSDIGPRSNGSRNDDLVGRFDGMVRGSNLLWEHVTVFYMYDGAPENPVPGCLGVLFLSHTSLPGGLHAPMSSGVTAFRAFAGEGSPGLQALPANDAERYAAMSRPGWDPPTPPHLKNDWSYLISSGPFQIMAPGATIQYNLALVAGDGLDDLLQNCADASLAWRGNSFDLVGDAWSYAGSFGNETLVCLEDIGPEEGGWTPFWSIVSWLGDRSCVDFSGLAYPPLPLAADELVHVNNKTCAWVNMDNCEECSRLAGRRCTFANRLWRRYSCSIYDAPSAAQLAACTGILGRERPEPWMTDSAAPPAPAVRVQPDNNAVHVFWDDSSESARDPFTGFADFESYRVMRADDWDRPWGTSVENGPPTSSWQLIDEFDLIDTQLAELVGTLGTVVKRDTLALGRNTGLDPVGYVPRCLSDPAFGGLAEAMQQIVDADVRNQYVSRPPVRDRSNVVLPGMAPLVPWEGSPAVLDTFFMVAARAADPDAGVIAKQPSRFYEYIDRNVHNGFLYFYAVTSTDKALEQRNDVLVCTGPGRASDPALRFTHVVPGTPAQTQADIAARDRDIYVYPNPATPRSLAELQQMHPNSHDPTGVRVMFTNLPRARNRIKVFSVDGDLIAEIDHDGRDGYGEASWNLVSRNGQQVAAGIYLFVVQSDDRRFKPFTGKFVLVW